MKWVDHITGETEDIRITQLGDKLFGVSHLRTLFGAVGRLSGQYRNPGSSC